jgi:hypothetical protein
LILPARADCPALVQAPGCRCCCIDTPRSRATATLTIPAATDYIAVALSIVDIIEDTNVADATVKRLNTQFNLAGIPPGIPWISPSGINAILLNGGDDSSARP